MAIQTGSLGIIMSSDLSFLPLSKEQSEALKVIAEWDFSPYRVDALKNRVVKEIYVDSLLIEAKRFLALPVIYKDPDFPFAPSTQVDAVWHFFILDTLDYTQFCDKVYGRYLHHTPEKSSSKTVEKQAGTFLGYTKKCLSESFGGYSPNIWGVSAYCDTGACRVEPTPTEPTPRP